MVVKADQPGLAWELERLFADAEPVGRVGTARTVAKGHGRLEVRRLRASTGLVGYSAWPDLAQAACLDRATVVLATGEVRRERAYAVTSLGPAEADAAALLALWRGHWRIESLHWTRDVLFAEDRSGATVGRGPQALAALRNATTNLLRAHGHHRLARTRRHLARAPHEPLPLLGLPPL